MACIVHQFSEVATRGNDGDRAESLLRSAKRSGVETLADLTEGAVRRLLRKGPGGVRRAKRLFDDDELDELARQLAAINSTADLLGRSRVRIRLGRMAKHSEDTDYTCFSSGPKLTPMSPSEAVAYFKKLVPTLGVNPKKFGPLMEASAFTMAEATSKKLLARCQSIILDALEQGGDAHTDAPGLLDDVLAKAGVTPKNPFYSQMVFRTNMMEAFRAGAQREFSSPDLADNFPVWRYIGIEDGRERAGPYPLPNHRQWFNRFFDRSIPFVKVRGTDAGNVINCLLPGNLVGGQVKAVLKARYAGEAVEVLAANGARFSVTVNHPVFSAKGIVAAGQVNEGDDLWCHVPQPHALAMLHEQDRPAEVEELFQSFNPVLLSEPVLALDFDGDGRSMHGDVEMVLPNGMLPSQIDALGFKNHRDIVLETANDRSVRGLGLLDSFGLGHLRPLHRLGLALASRLDARFKQSLSDGSAVDLEELRELLLGHLLDDVHFPQLAGGNRLPSDCARFGPASQFDAVLRQPATNGVALDAEFLSKLQQARPGEVSLGKVIQVRRFHYDGPVYDVSTPVGYFTAGHTESASVLTRNCRCDFIPIYKADWKSLRAGGARKTSFKAAA